MKVALATENGQVTGHCGRSSELTLVRIEGKRVLEWDEFPSPGPEPGLLVSFLVAHGVSWFIAGQMEAEVRLLLRNRGVEPLTGVEGPVGQVLWAFLQGTLRAADTGINRFSGGAGS